jgi:four helix bundle protein
MFDFEKLEVYKKVREANQALYPILDKLFDKDPYLCERLRDACVGVAVNLVEGTGRQAGPDKRQFYIDSRGSLFEAVAILQIMQDQQIISEEDYDDLYGRFEQVSKMMLGMIRNTPGTEKQQGPVESSWE